MWLFISSCPISSWSQRITVVLTWLFSVPLFYRDMIVANWHHTRGTSGLQLVRSSWGLLPWGNGQGAQGSHLCRWDLTLAPRIPVKWDLDKHASYVLSPDSSGQEQKWVVFGVAVVCSCICSSWSCELGPCCVRQCANFKQKGSFFPSEFTISGYSTRAQMGGHPKRRERRFASTNQQNTQKLWPVISIFLQAWEKTGG